MCQRQLPHSVVDAYYIFLHLLRGLELFRFPTLRLRHLDYDGHTYDENDRFAAHLLTQNAAKEKSICFN